MTFRRSLPRIAAGVGLAAALWFVASGGDEPSHAGRTASDWIPRLAHPDHRVRAEAESALLAIGPDAWPSIVRGLERQEMPLRRLISPWLRRLPWIASDPPDATAIRTACAELLGRFSPAATPVAPRLVAALGDPHGAVAQESARSLRRLGEPALPALAVGLDHADARVRARSAEVLADFGSVARTLQPRLQQGFRDGDREVRAAAARAASRVDPSAPGVASNLAALLGDGEATVRAAAVEALGHCAPEARAYLPALTARLSDRHSSVRVQACRALWRLEVPADRVVPVLIDLLSDREAGWQAAFLLGEVGPAASNAVPALVEALRRETVPRPLRSPPSAAIALGKIGAASVPGLLPLLSDPRPTVRVGAVLAIGLVGPAARNAGPQLFERIEDPDSQVRTAAALALGSIDAANQRLVPLLKVLSREDDILISSSALSLLHKLDPAAAAGIGPE